MVSLSASTLSGPPKQRPFDHKVGLAIMITEYQFEGSLITSFSLRCETNGYNTLVITFDPLRIAFEPHGKQAVCQERKNKRQAISARRGRTLTQSHLERLP